MDELIVGIMIGIGNWMTETDGFQRRILLNGRRYDKKTNGRRNGGDCNLSWNVVNGNVGLTWSKLAH